MLRIQGNLPTGIAEKVHEIHGQHSRNHRCIDIDRKTQNYCQGQTETYERIAFPYDMEQDSTS